MKRKILLGLLLLFLGMQAIQISKTNPPVEAQYDFIASTNPPAEVQKMLRDACYDCHSFETKYPWYTYTQPLGWWIQGHIRGGRRHLNFSEWGKLSDDDKIEALEESVEEIKENNMPLLSYTWGHSEAKLTLEQRRALGTWLESLKSQTKAYRHIGGDGRMGGGESSEETED